MLCRTQAFSDLNHIATRGNAVYIGLRSEVAPQHNIPPVIRYRQETTGAEIIVT